MSECRLCGLCCAPDGRSRAATAKIILRDDAAGQWRSTGTRTRGCTVEVTEAVMEITRGPLLVPTPERIAQLDQLGDEIGELSAHLEAGTARLLDLIREFDARGGWGNGFRMC